MDFYSSDVFGSAESWIKLGHQFAEFQVKEKYLKSTSIYVRVGPGLFLFVILFPCESFMKKLSVYREKQYTINVDGA